MDVLDEPETSAGGVLTWSEIRGRSNKVQHLVMHCKTGLTVGPTWKVMRL